MNKLARGIAALGLALSLGAHAEVPIALCGEAAPLAKATRTIVILPGMKYVNVKQGEVVKFVTENGEFAFFFNGPDVAAFDLQRIAPTGALNHRVIAYVARNLEDEGALAR